jgi:hypothetical protein
VIDTTEPLDGVQHFARMVDGGAFVLDAPLTVPCIWGRGRPGGHLLIKDFDGGRPFRG